MFSFFSFPVRIMILLAQGRSSQGGSAMAFAVGDTVTYYSKSQAQEFDATVTAVSPTNGSIQINLKPGVWMAPGDVTAKRPAQGGQGREELLSSGLNDLFIFSKLRQPRSRLYRRQILQINIRWKALDENLRSTRFTYFCTAQTSIFQQTLLQPVCMFQIIYSKRLFQQLL